VLGAIAGASQLWGIQYSIGYSYQSLEHQGTVVGFPFMIVFFDMNGHDFSNPVLSIASMFGNALFWGLVPYLILVLCFYLTRVFRRKQFS